MSGLPEMVSCLPNLTNYISKKKNYRNNKLGIKNASSNDEAMGALIVNRIYLSNCFPPFFEYLLFII